MVLGVHNAQPRIEVRRIGIWSLNLERDFLAGFHFELKAVQISRMLNGAFNDSGNGDALGLRYTIVRFAFNEVRRVDGSRRGCWGLSLTVAAGLVASAEDAPLA